MKIIKIKEIKGTITALTGLHIGMGNQEIHIGGIDNPVIKDPLTNEPYIPGSSIKGKMRTLLEYYTDRVRTERGRRGEEIGVPYYPQSRNEVADDPICRIFGSGKPEWSATPTRLIVRDAFLSEEFKSNVMRVKEISVSDLYEGKFETAIDRKTGTAKGGSLRQTERVVAGTSFEFSMIYKIFDNQDEQNFKLIEKALNELLPNDALGGSGSRGYGRIKIDYEVIEHNYSNDTGMSG
jgi:CRISPR-associated protein Csm3